MQLLLLDFPKSDWSVYYSGIIDVYNYQQNVYKYW